MLQASTEKDWIEGCKKNDRAAQKQVYERFSSRMLGVCLRYLGNRPDAEEILLNGFLKVFEKIGQYKNEGSFEGWIRRIMVNECLNHLRKQKFLYVEYSSQQVTENNDLTYNESRFEVEDLLQLIDKLPQGYKTVFNLYAIEGYSHLEIAEMLGINENTSKSQLSRARAWLQREIANLEKELNDLYHG